MKQFYERLILLLQIEFIIFTETANMILGTILGHMVMCMLLSAFVVALHLWFLPEGGNPLKEAL